jgi:integrase
MAARFGAAEGLLVLLIGYAALRIGEGLDLRVDDFVWRDSRYRLRIMFQHSPTVRRHEHGRAPGRQATKEQRDPVPVLVPPPDLLNDDIRAFLAGVVGRAGDGPVFRGPRGGRLTADTFRDTHWHKVINELYADGHRLHGITPHAGRHFGMTRWLRSGIDPARCARWGRWKSIKVMLDVYAGVLPSDETHAFDRIDRDTYGAGPDDGPVAAHLDDGVDLPEDAGAGAEAAEGTATMAEPAVVDPDEYRRNRSA